MNGYLPEPSAKIAAGKTEAWVDLLRTLADPIRLRMLRLLELQGQGLSVGELADVLKLPQSTVSRHLKTLTDSDLAQARREGTSTFYRLSESAAVNSVGHLRRLSRQHVENDPAAKADSQRLAQVLRQRQAASEKFFGKAAAQWDQLRKEWFGETFHLEAMLALMNPAWVVADLGTGTGAMAALISPHVKQVIAVDSSPAMLKGAKARVRDQQLQNVDIRQGSLESLPMERASIDVALLALVLHHTVEPAAALREIHRVLRPGGVLLIVDLQPHQVELFREKMEHRWMGFAQETLEGWLKEAGFVQTRWHALPAQTARSKENHTQVPDLFAMRAEAA